MAPSNSFVPLPFGLRDLQVFPLTGETPGSGLDLAANQKLTFAEAETYVELRGDDALQAVHGKGPQVDWDITAGGVTLDVVKAITGGTITESGTWNNGAGTGKRVFTKKSTNLRPYFRLEGQAYSDSGGDFHVILYRCKLNGNITGTMDENAFWLTGAKGIALPRISDGSLYDFVQNEQAAAIGPNVPVLVAHTPPLAPVHGAAYIYTFTALGDTPITWAVASGALPAGLLLDTAAGVLYGAVTGAGTSTFTVSATNAAGTVTSQSIVIVAS